MKLIIAFRPFRWFFYKNWWSVYRWNHPTAFDGQFFRLIDMGAITIGYRRPYKRSDGWI